MGRVNSATVYGTARLDLARVPASSRRAYGLRSSSSLDGYYPAYGRKPKRKRATVVDNVEQPIAGPESDDVRPIRVVKPAAPQRDRVDDAELRHLAGTIRMGDF